MNDSFLSKTQREWKEVEDRENANRDAQQRYLSQIQNLKSKIKDSMQKDQEKKQQ